MIGKQGSSVVHLMTVCWKTLCASCLLGSDLAVGYRVGAGVVVAPCQSRGGGGQGQAVVYLPAVGPHRVPDPEREEHKPGRDLQGIKRGSVQETERPGASPAGDDAEGREPRQQEPDHHKRPAAPRSPVTGRVPFHPLEQMQFGDALPQGDDVTALLKPAQIICHLGPHGRELHRAVRQQVAVPQDRRQLHHHPFRQQRHVGTGASGGASG